MPAIAVIGGSLTGLTCALLLRDAGMDVEVYERSPAPLEGRGVGIVLHPASARYLLRRTAVDLASVSASASVHRYLDRDGRVVSETARRHYFTAYNSLYGALLEAFDRRRYHLDRRLVALQASADRVQATLASGVGEEVCVHCDLLVGADGISSTVRQQMLPAVVPRYAGYVAWRGVVEESELPPATFDLLADSLTYHIGRRSHALTYPIPNLDGSVAVGRRLMNLVWYRNVAPGAELTSLLTDRAGRQRDVSVPPGHVRPEALAEMRAAARRELPPSFVDVVERMAEPFLQVLYDVEVPRMTFQRVCLVGDAAFAVRPHAATATAKGAEDAWALVGALQENPADVGAALRAWEPAQMQLGAALLARNRQMGDDVQLRERWQAGDPDLAFGLRRPGDSANMSLAR